MGQLLSFVERFAKLSGLIERVTDLDEALHRCENRDMLSDRPLVKLEDSVDTIEFDDVNICTPAKKLLAKVNLTSTAGSSLYCSLLNFVQNKESKYL